MPKDHMAMMARDLDKVVTQIRKPCLWRREQTAGLRISWLVFPSVSVGVGPTSPGMTAACQICLSLQVSILNGGAA